MRTPRSKLKSPAPAKPAAPGWKPIQYVVGAERTSGNGTRYHHQSIAAASKREACATYQREWPGSVILWCVAPSEPMPPFPHKP